MNSPRLSRVLLLLLFCATALRAQDVVPVQNSSFEDLYQGEDVPTGAFPVGPPPEGWTRYDLNGAPVPGSLLGVLNPGTQEDYDADGGGLTPCFPDGAPEGDNVALLFKSGPNSADEYGIEQVLGESLQANTSYRLAVDVGNIQTCAGLVPGDRTTFNLEGFPGYRIELRAGNQALATDDNTLRPDEGTFERSVIDFDSGDNPPQPGQALAIRLVSLNQADGGGNLEVNFDDVVLTAMPQQAVPLPDSLVYALGAMLLAVAIRRTKVWVGTGCSSVS